MFIKVLSANLASIAFLLFTGWCLYYNHLNFAVVSIIVAISGATTLKPKDDKEECLERMREEIKNLKK